MKEGPKIRQKTSLDHLEGEHVSIVGTKESPIKANIGEHIKVGDHVFKITESGQLDRGMNQIAGFERVG